MNDFLDFLDEFSPETLNSSFLEVSANLFTPTRDVVEFSDLRLLRMKSTQIPFVDPSSSQESSIFNQSIHSL